MKFIPFADATHSNKAYIKENGKQVVVELPYYSHEGYTVVKIALDSKELKDLNTAKGEFYIVLGPGVPTPPPFVFKVASPFTPNPDSKILKADGSHYGKNETKKSTGDDQQHNEGNSKPD